MPSLPIVAVVADRARFQMIGCARYVSGLEQNPLNPSGLPELVGGGGGVPPMAHPGAQSYGDEPIHLGPDRRKG